MRKLLRNFDSFVSGFTTSCVAGSSAVMAEQPVIVQAPSGRSKCKACVYVGEGNPTIEQGSMRVGIPGHAAGVTVYHWCHPTCFAKHCLRVDLAPTGRAKCKADGTDIPKGSIRLLIGYKKESTTYKVENVHLTLVPTLLTLVGATKMTIHGLGELSLDDRLRVENLVFASGSDNRKRTEATRKRALDASDERNVKQAKPREKDAKQAKNSAKRRKREVQCEADYVDGEDGEICD
jgi:hypothetical protein